MTVGGKQIEESIVIKIQKHGSPTHIRMSCVVKPGFPSYVIEHFTLIFVEGVVIVRIRRDENVGLAIVVVVANSQPHVGLFGSVAAAGDTPRQRVFLEFSITLVVVEVVETRIIGHENVRTTIAIEVLKQHS